VKVNRERLRWLKRLERKIFELKVESIMYWGPSARLLFTRFCDLLLLLRTRWASHVLRKSKFRIMDETSVASEEDSHSAKSRRRREHVTKITRHNVPEDTNTNTHHCGNLIISHRQTHYKLKHLSCN
jgi:hypothetical protein